MLRAILLVASLGLHGCRCGEPIDGPVPEEPLRFPEALDFGDVWPGSRRTLTLEVFNPGRAGRTFDVTGPSTAVFRAAVGPRRVGGGDTVRLEVEFIPRRAGVFDDALAIDGQPVTLRGTARTPPACAGAPCREAVFDPGLGTCVERVLPDDSPCTPELACFEQGRCVAGMCRAAVARACDDGDACTVDACGAEGCVHVPVRCEVTDPCRVARCDTLAGCVSEPVDDGSPCGPSTCREARVCIAGQCVSRPTQNRPEDCRYVQLASSLRRACGLTRSGRVRCWGSTGCGSPTPYPTLTPLGTTYCFEAHPPVEVARFGSNVVSIAMNVMSTLAVDGDGGLLVTPGWPLPDAGSLSSVVCDLSERCAGLTRDGNAIGWATNFGPPSPFERSGPFRSVAAWMGAILFDGGVSGPRGDLSLPAPARSIQETGLSYVLLENGQLWWGPFNGAMSLVPSIDGGVSVFGVRGAGTPVQLCVGRTGGQLECVGEVPLAQTLPGEIAQIAWPCVLLDGGDAYCSRRGFESVEIVPRLREARGRLLDGPNSLIASAQGEFTEPMTARARRVPGVVSFVRGYVRVDGGSVFDSRGTEIATDVVAEAWSRFTESMVFHLQGDGGLLLRGFPTGIRDLVSVGGEGLLLRDGGLLAFDRGQELVPVPVEPIRALGDGSCALSTRGRVVCWALEADGGATITRPAAGLFPRMVSGSARGGCALSGENGLRCWGDNTFGQLGRVGPPSDRPVDLPMARPIRRVRHGENFVCVETELGVECWGLAPRAASDELVPWVE